MRFPNRGTDAPVSDVRSKVPHVTLALGHQDPRDPPGETGGDALSMTLELGYATSTLIFLASRSPWSLRSRRAGTTRSGYWAVVVPTTTVGTTMSDYLDRTRGLRGVLPHPVGRGPGHPVRLAPRHGADRVQTSFGRVVMWSRSWSRTHWHRARRLRGDELGPRLRARGAGLRRPARPRRPGAPPHADPEERALLGRVLTRPLGATLGDTLTKPHPEGGLGLSRIASSLGGVHRRRHSRDGRPGRPVLRFQAPWPPHPWGVSSRCLTNSP